MKAILAGSALAALVLAGPAWAFPDKPITIIVPAAAGGPSDTVARLVAQSMGDTLGQQVLVVGHSNTVPMLVSTLCACPVPPIDESVYGEVYEVRIRADGDAALHRLQRR